jgi:TrmH family RNA methyltransferase
MKLDDIKKLNQKKYREQFGCFIVEGEHLVQELDRATVGNPRLKAARLYVTESHLEFPTSFEKTVISNKNMALWSDTKTPQGILAVVPMSALVAIDTEKGAPAIYLHEVQDPGNLGTILRTLAWFGNFRCLLSPNSVDPYNPKTVRASMGAIFHVPIEQDVAPESLAARHTHFACLDLHGAPLTSPSFHRSDCLVFGNEARGIPAVLVERIRATRYSITGGGAIDSLNLASVVNMAVYELRR